MPLGLSIPLAQFHVTLADLIACLALRCACVCGVLDCGRAGVADGVEEILQRAVFEPLDGRNVSRSIDL